MSYITPSQFRSGLEETKEYVDSRVVSGGGSGGSSIVKAHIIGTGPNDSGWLSLEENGTAIIPNESVMYIIQTLGNYYARAYMWDGGAYRIVAENVNFEYKQSTEEIQNPIEPVAIYARGSSIPGASHSFTVPKNTKSVRYQFDTNSYNLRCRMGVPGKEIDVANTAYTKPFDRTVQITDDDWGKTFTIDLYNISSDGSYGVYLQWNTLTIEKEWEEEKLEFLSPTTTEDGKPGLVPAAAAGTTDRVLTQDGWDETPFNITPTEIKEAFNSVAGGEYVGNNEYSTTEQMIGHWIDNRPLYRKTFVLTNMAPFPYYSWKDTGIVMPDLDRIINAQACINNVFTSLVAHVNSEKMVLIMHLRESEYYEISQFFLTLEYTKATD